MSRHLFSSKNTFILGLIATVFLIVAGTFYSYTQSNQSAKAAGVTPTITPQVAAVSTSGTTTYAYVTSATLPIGSRIFLTYPNAYTGVLSTANTTVNTVAPTTLTNAIGASTTTSTITLANTVTSGSTVTISTSVLTTPATAGNYAITYTSTVGDFGGNFQYVGSTNIVNVTAAVPVSLSFVIRNTGDTLNTNVCDLGTADTASISSCSYRLKVGTNAKNGYTVSFTTSGALTDGSYNMTDSIAGPTGTAASAGTELYGVDVTPGAITGAGGSITLVSAYNSTGANLIRWNPGSTVNLYTANKPNNPAASADTTNTTLISHSLAISSNTPAGNFTQSVTYFVAPAF